MSHRIQLSFICLLFLAAGSSCVENTAEANAESTNENITQKNVDTLPQINHKEILFDRLVHRMDSLGLDPDTTYFDETMYQEGVFHYTNYESYFFHELLIDKSIYGDLISVEYKSEYDERFSRVTDIKLYPWRMPNTPEGRMRNGVVELWTFENTSDAEYVYEFLENELKYQGFPFIKTRPYYVQCGKWVYMFHSPDSGVSYRHQQFYDWIKKQCK